MDACARLFVDHCHINVIIHVLNFRSWSQPRNYFNSEIFPIYSIQELAMYWLYTVAKLIVSVINYQLEHTVHEQQAILLTMVPISYTFCMENAKDLTPRGVWQ